MSIALRVEKLSYTYPDGVVALHEVSFEVREGETVGIVGRNGAGKSTLLLHLNGVLTGTGRIEVLGQALSPHTLAQVRRDVGLVFQNPDDQLFMPTVYEDVAFGPMNAGLADEEVRRCVDEALAAVGMTGFEDRPPHHLSIGQKKRVAIATVLAMSPRVIVFDEPMGALDPVGREQILQLLEGLPVARIIATHDLELARRLCDRLLVLDAGRVVADRQANEILSDDELLRAHGLRPCLRPAARC